MLSARARGGGAMSARGAQSGTMGTPKAKVPKDIKQAVPLRRKLSDVQPPTSERRVRVSTSLASASPRPRIPKHIVEELLIPDSPKPRAKPLVKKVAVRRKAKSEGADTETPRCSPKSRIRMRQGITQQQRGYSCPSTGLQPHEVTSKDQWDQLVAKDMEIAEEIPGLCERVVEAGANVDIIADQIRDLERRDSMQSYLGGLDGRTVSGTYSNAASGSDARYFSACETRSGSSACSFQSPTPDYDFEFASVGSLLNRSSKMQTLVERRDNLVQELMSDIPPPAPEAFYAAAGHTGFSSIETSSGVAPTERWARCEQLIDELTSPNSPPHRLRHMRCDIVVSTTTLVNAAPEPVEQRLKVRMPSARRFSSEPPPQASSGTQLSPTSAPRAASMNVHPAKQSKQCW